jgi:endo-1,4-beta-mannosidase
MRQKRYKKRGFLIIHIAVDVKSKQITGLKLTNENSYTSKYLVPLVEQSKEFGNVIKILADDHMIQKFTFHICIMKI